MLLHPTAVHHRPPPTNPPGARVSHPVVSVIPNCCFYSFEFSRVPIIRSYTYSRFIRVLSRVMRTARGLGQRGTGTPPGEFPRWRREKPIWRNRRTVKLYRRDKAARVLRGLKRFLPSCARRPYVRRGRAGANLKYLINVIPI